MEGTAEKRLLVVDDESIFKVLVTEILLHENYAVDGAGNGKEALERLSAFSYDLIISDVHMPRMDGLSLYLMISRERPWLRRKVLFLTGDLTNEAASFFRENRCEYMVKPFSRVELLGRIDRMLTNVSSCPFSRRGAYGKDIGRF
ncbi:MAG: response regulator [Deltaproteobacteria bacterium]|nr:response regulator [Deltaproteobacteria bacterium]